MFMVLAKNHLGVGHPHVCSRYLLKITKVSGIHMYVHGTC